MKIFIVLTYCTMLFYLCIPQVNANTEEKTNCGEPTTVIRTFTVNKALPKFLVELNWKTNDILKNINIYSVNKSGKKLLQKIAGFDTNLTCEISRDNLSSVSIYDIDADGYGDLMIETSSGTGGIHFNLFIYNKKHNVFELNKSLSRCITFNSALNMTVYPPCDLR